LPLIPVRVTQNHSTSDLVAHPARAGLRHPSSGGHKGGIAFQADKNDYRGVLADLEGVTGKKAVNSDAKN
jgi:hypothetical protein